MSPEFSFANPETLKAVGSLICAIALISTLVALSFRIRENDEDKWINLSTIVLGLTLGWILGMYIAPYKDKGEPETFRALAAEVSVFVSGYLIGKIDGLIH